jgi:ribosomal protein S18 acetylase RimI-like enzyme
MASEWSVGNCVGFLSPRKRSACGFTPAPRRQFINDFGTGRSGNLADHCNVEVDLSFICSCTLTFVKTSATVIRNATPSDLDACALLISNHVSGESEEWRSRFEQDLANPRRLFLVATIDDSVVAYGHTTFHTRTSDNEANAGPGGYFLSGLLVSPAHRRQGLGTLLTSARIDELRQVTDVIYYRAESDNQATIDMHSQLGFKEVGAVKRDGRDFMLFCLELSEIG